MLEDLTTKLNPDRRTEPFKPTEQLPFGKLRSDHMFLMDYSEGEWHSPRLVPRQPIKLKPGASVFHYGQEIFEGAKAFQHPDGEIYTFRLDQNCQRFNNSAEIMAMPPIPVEDQLQAIHSLIDIDRLWFPQQAEASLYIRPFMFSTTDALGVKPGKDYLFCVILSPSGPYYSQGFNPGKMLLSNRFRRVAEKGTGKAKAGGNYGASLRAGEFAKKLGCQQVLYLDARDEFLEEYGAMNHFQVTREGKILIPEFTDTILESITARSFLELGERLGHPIEQARLSASDFVQGLLEKKITEAGGLGTACVVSPVGSYMIDLFGEIKDKPLVIGNGQVGPISQKMYGLLTGIQYGKLEAPKGWLHQVERNH